MNKHALLKKLSILDFMATDLAMYLDTHPCEQKAILVYNQIVEDSDKVRKEYESLCGPLCAKTPVKNGNSWDWIDDPWPWQEQFNCEL